MALTVGELNAIITADTSGLDRGVAQAGQAMTRLREEMTDEADRAGQDAGDAAGDGVERGLRSRLEGAISRMAALGRRIGSAIGGEVADEAEDGAERAKTALAGIGKAMVGLGAGVPVAAAAATAAGGMAASFAAAGLAAKAFQAAAGPQMESVTTALEAAEKAEQAHELATRKKAAAQKLAKQGGDEYKAALREAESAAKAAKDADAEYEAQLKALPPATRTMAKELQGLKDDHQKWSDSLSGTTMPVFTKGLQILRSLLPSLTPFVHAAAGAMSRFLDDVARGVKSARFKEWAADMAAASGTALSNFLQVIKNIAIGFGGLLQAFAPASAGMTGGLVSMSKAFADWATSLKGSEGFADFLSLAESGGDTLGNLARAVLDLLVAMGPLVGVTTQLVNILAQVVSSVPTPVLTALASALLAVRVGMMAYRTGASIVAGANAVMASSAWTATTAWIKSAAASTAAMARTAAAAVANATRTAAAWAMAAARATATWLVTILRVAAVSVAQFAMMAARAVVWAATMAAQWLIAMGPVGWITAAVIGLVALIVANWDKIKNATIAAWNWVWTKIKQFASFIWNLFLNWTIAGRIIKHWDAIKAGTARVWNAIINWIKGVPGKIWGALSSLGAKVWSLATSAWNRFKTANITIAMATVAWVRGLPGRISGALGNLGSLLYSKGMDVVRGLWNGIRSMGGWIRSQIMSWAKSAIPGPIAKALGIASPSKVTTAQGRWIARGLVEGLTGSARQVRSAAQRLADIVRDRLAPGRRRSRALDRIGDDSRALARLASQEERLAARMKDASKRIADLVKARDKLAADVRKGVLDAGNITGGTEGGLITADAILGKLQTGVIRAQQFARDLAALTKKGFRSDLVAQIAQAGVEQGSAAAAALASASSQQVKQINAQQKLLTSAADRAGATAGTAMYGAGIQAARGLIDGLRKQDKAIEAQMLRIAKSMQTAIKKALGIRSPSRVMAALGQYIPAGLAQGIRAGQGAVDASMAGLVDPSRLAIPEGAVTRTGRAGAGAAPGAERPLLLKLSIGDREFGEIWVDTGRRVVRTRGGLSAVFG